MRRDFFTFPAAREIIKLLDQASYMTTSRSTTFRAWLEMCVCALAGGTLEERYLRVIQPYISGDAGRRPVDAMAHAFAVLVNNMEEIRQAGSWDCDILGDVFQGGITFGENGQYFTPFALCGLMAAVTDSGGDDDGKSVIDCCCGSGRMLIAKASTLRTFARFGWQFVGQDVNERCVMMTAVNMALLGIPGHVTLGNSLDVRPSSYPRPGYIISPLPALAFGGAVLRAFEMQHVPAEPVADAAPVTTTAPAAPAVSPAMQRSLFDDE